MPQVGRYQDIADSYRKKIENGEYQDGELLESVASLAKRWEIHKNTAYRVIQELQRSGHVRSEYGGGTYVQLPVVKPE